MLCVNCVDYAVICVVEIVTTCSILCDCDHLSYVCCVVCVVKDVACSTGQTPMLLKLVGEGGMDGLGMSLMREFVLSICCVHGQG